MRTPNSSPREQELRDWLGRSYRVGLRAEDLIGRSREWMLWAPSAAMAMVGVLQYGYGVMVPSLVAAHGWRPTEAFWLLAVWTVFQAGVGFCTALLRERGRIGPRAILFAGACLCTVGPLSLAHGGALTAALVGYSIISGTGAGLVYAACTSTVAKWHPDRMAGKVSAATGAFAYGSAPFVLAFVLGMRADTLVPMLDVTAAVIGIVVGAAALLLRDPPPGWWPSHVDPREWALDRRLSPGRAVRQFSTREAMRTGTLPTMYVILLCASAVSLFDVTFFAAAIAELGLVTPLVAVTAGLLVGVNGAGRAHAMRVSDVIGRRGTLGIVLATLALGQLCLAGAATSGSVTLVAVAALLCGAGGGAFYPLFASLVREYFGERNTADIHAVVYSAKALGGVVGVGLAALAAPTWGYAALFTLAGAVALISAALTRYLRRPGHVLTLPLPRSP